MAPRKSQMLWMYISQLPTMGLDSVHTRLCPKCIHLSCNPWLTEKAIIVFYSLAGIKHPFRSQIKFIYIGMKPNRAQVMALDHSIMKLSSLPCDRGHQFRISQAIRKLECPTDILHALALRAISMHHARDGTILYWLFLIKHRTTILRIPRGLSTH